MQKTVVNVAIERVVGGGGQAVGHLNGSTQASRTAFQQIFQLIPGMLAARFIETDGEGRTSELSSCKHRHLIGTASNNAIGVCVRTVRSRRNPAAANNSENSSWVLSRPPAATSISMSKSNAGTPSGPGATNISQTSTRPLSLKASRQFPRIRRVLSSPHP